MRTALVLLFTAVSALAAEPSVDMLWGVKIPMRDGVHLNATIYKPAGDATPQPVIFTLTPYIADTYLDRASYFARHGYVFALVDVRGRGNSEGKFEPFANEGRDGHDVVEWLAKQPFCNGKVTMWGGSYAGYDQWATLKERPPHLATIVPAAAVHPAIDFPFLDNIFYPYDMQWLTFTSGVTPNQKTFGDGPFWIARYQALARDHVPFRELDRITGNATTVFQKWIEHPIPDAYWDAMTPSPDDYRAITVPILTITGHYDGDQPGAMTYYRRHMQYGTAEAKAKHYIVIGPWDHAATRTPRKEIGGLTFGEASMVDLNKLHKEWYDFTMKGGPKPEFLKKRVAYYVTGAEEWKYADSLENIPMKTRTLYLDSSGEANDVFHSGTLAETQPSASKADRYVYDPLDTRMAELESEEIRNPITDQRYALNLFGAELVYHSAPMPKETDLTGWVRLTVSLSMDVPDTDLGATLYEIKPDGTSVQLTSDIKRARYRESLRQEKLVTPGEIDRYVFDSFTFVSRRLAKGSRLRLVVGASNTINLERNYNSGGAVAGESAKDARTAHVTLYHDAQHPSFLELPMER
jgi:putative CocE/NonD family hydrolase